METLRQGSRSDQVKLLQRSLSKEIAPSARRVKRIQEKRKASGRRRSEKMESTVSRRSVAQPAGMICWSASASMILGNQSVGPGGATLGSDGGLNPTDANVEVFAKSVGRRMFYPMSWTVGGIADLLRRGPAWAVGGGIRLPAAGFTRSY